MCGMNHAPQETFLLWPDRLSDSQPMQKTRPVSKVDDGDRDSKPIPTTVGLENPNLAW